MLKNKKMKRLIDFIKKIKFLLLILVSTAFIHFLWLDRIPPGMSHDEVVYSLSSKAFFLQGTDITGTGFPMGLFRTQTEGNISILPTILLSPMHYFFTTTQFSARLPYVLLLHLGSIAVFLIAKKLFNNDKIGLLSMFLFLMEPWSFFLSRFAAEPPVGLTFYLWGTAMLFFSKGRKLIIPFLLFTLGFYSYHGGKILFLPLVFVCLLYVLSLKKINKKEFAYFLSGALVVFVSFFIISFSLPGGIIESRKNEIFFLNKDFLSETVDTRRKLTLENQLTPFFANKLSTASGIFFEKYITAFSTKILFLQGDSRVFYSFLYHGLLYVFDAVFILIGFVSVFIKQKRAGLLLLGFLLIAPLPSAVNGIENSYINRSSFLLVVFVILSAYGIYQTFLFLSKNLTKFAGIVLLTGGMGMIIGNFLFFYFFRYPLVVGDFFSLGERVTAEFIRRDWSQQKKFVVVQSEPGEMYLETVFFFNDKHITDAFLSNIEKFNKGSYELPNIIYKGECPNSYDSSTIYIVHDAKRCELPDFNAYTIKNPRDAGVMYKVYNSNLCMNFQLKQWQRYHFISDYDIASMDTKTFCERWITI
jgi:hypothetical protein